MKILRASAKNFLSWEKFDYIFEPEVIAISGNNKTQEDQGSNGSGKSGIQQIIYFGIIGSSMKNVLDKKLIRNDCEEASTEITIDCPLRGQVLNIERRLLLKGSSKLEISINGDPVQFANINDGNKLILEWIGISAEDLKSYFIICKEYYKSFFKSSNTDKMALISRFINFSFIDKTKSIIDEDISYLNEDKQVLEKEKSMLEGKLEVYEETLVKEELRDIESEKLTAIEKVQEMISSIKKDIVEIGQNIKDDDLKIVEYDRLIEEIKTSLDEQILKLDSMQTTKEFDETIFEIREILKGLHEEQHIQIDEKRKLEKERENIRREIQKININLSGTITCPSCGHEFLTLKNTSLEEERERKVTFGKKDDEIIKQLGIFEKNLSDYEATISEAIQQKSEIEEEKDVVLENLRVEKNTLAAAQNYLKTTLQGKGFIQSQIKNNEESVKINLERISTLEKQIEDIQAQKDERNIEEIENNITNTAVFIRQKEALIQEKKSEIYTKEQWINRFKDFKRFLAVEQLKNIQAHTNDLLKKQRSDLRLMLEGFKIGSNNKLKEEITPYVLREEPESFWYYSGGERARVELATIIAFQMLINSTNPYGGLEFLFVDEITEGLSEEGLYNIIESLNFIKYPILIITHVSNQNVKCKALKVEKNNGISKLV